MRQTLIFLLFIILVTSCKKLSEVEMSFSYFGDSHINNWDLNYWFPFSENSNYGIAGSKISDLVRTADEIQKAENQVILIGINDIIQLSSTWGDDEVVDIVLSQYELLMNILDSKSIILSIMPVTINYEMALNFTINSLVHEVNQSIKLMCDEKHITFVDTSFALGNGSGLKEEFTLDGIHLNNLGYEAISKVLRPYIY